MPTAKGPSRICVLGMHRSGTSYLTGSLAQAGVALGPASQWNPHNQRGNQELDQVVALNDEVLAANGGAWDHPPEHVEWSSSQVARAAEIVADLDARQPWAFKDPRTLLTLAGWRRVAPDLSFVGVFRHPDAVATSLQRRAEYGGSVMSDVECDALWLAYNNRLLSLLSETSFPVVSFDLSAGELAQAVARVIEALGLPPVEPSFWAAELRHETGGRRELPAQLRDCYDRLLAAAGAWS